MPIFDPPIFEPEIFEFGEGALPIPPSGRYDYWGDIWPGYNRPAPIIPVRVGVDRKTWRPIFGFNHVFMSMTALFETRYHERVLRRWVGSLVPHLLGELATIQNITRFYFAFGTSLDLFEPGFQIRRVYVRKAPQDNPEAEPLALNTVNKLRAGAIRFQHDGVFMPRGHLGDPTPADRRHVNLLQREGRWEVQP
jgi:phage baseplate assembly protein W